MVDLDELRRLRVARSRMDRDFAEPLDVAALARTALMSSAHFSRRFREAYGETPYPGIQLVLSHPRAGRSEADGEAVAALLAKGELGGVNLRADDLDAVFERAAAHEGAEVVQEPTDQFWGVRDIALRDPAGNLVRIEQSR